jgi:uncharacterized protein YqhQ
MEKTTFYKGLFAVCIGWICCRGFVVLPDIYADFFRTQSPSVYFFVLEGFLHDDVTFLLMRVWELSSYRLDAHSAVTMK